MSKLKREWSQPHGFCCGVSQSTVLRFSWTILPVLCLSSGRRAMMEQISSLDVMCPTNNLTACQWTSLDHEKTDNLLTASDKFCLVRNRYCSAPTMVLKRIIPRYATVLWCHWSWNNLEPCRNGLNYCCDCWWWRRPNDDDVRYNTTSTFRYMKSDVSVRDGLNPKEIRQYRSFSYHPLVDWRTRIDYSDQCNLHTWYGCLKPEGCDIRTVQISV